ncbi:hypothetical protein FM125_00775 [Micrococcus lylae]|nr:MULTISPECIES: DUF3099 domain-containing protein [Micrococcus]OFR86211.1 hypothetical protein HMPREF2863_04605 [Micrococcus sp. HMSC067E09]WIK82882.1 DUF3099 domain-containing protein [Micrococcus lylae]SJN16218.1 hypothetical protein FM125_00775 [Micrococcus lylae]
MAASAAEACGPAAIQSVTTAPQASSADREQRMRKYLIQMIIRTGCFIGAFFADGWLQIVLFAAAAVLPYVAVVGSNNARPYSPGTMQAPATQATALAAEPSEPTAPSTAQDVVVGEVVEDTPALPAGSWHRPEDSAQTKGPAA